MKEIVSAVTSKGQVTLPREVRRQLGIGTRDRVAFVISDDGKIEVRTAFHTLQSVRGVIPPLPGRETTDFEDQIEEALAPEADMLPGRTEAR